MKFVIALGGSVAFPRGIDIDFLKDFHSFIKKEIKKGNQFIIVVGGGHITREYQQGVAQITKVNDEDKDWIGIHATRLNAHFLRTMFRQESHSVVFDSRFKLKGFDGHAVIIGSGWRPGNSTDFVAVQIAADLAINRVIILGKPDYVYTSDFEKDNTAKPIEEITWADYLKLIPKTWEPGLHAPVDPVAARLAKKEGIRVIVAKGKDLRNLGNILGNKRFKGTILA